MSDYDLGTAHGEVVIDYDKKTAGRVVASMERIGKAAKSLRGRIGLLGDSFTRMGDRATDSFSNISARVGLLATAAQTINRFSNANGRLGKSFALLRGNAGVLRSISVASGQIPEGMRNYPSAIKNVVRLSAAIGLLKTGVPIIRKFVKNSEGMAKVGAIVNRMGVEFDGLKSKWPILERGTDTIKKFTRSMVDSERGIVTIRSARDAFRRVTNAVRGLDAGIKTVASFAFAVMHGAKAIKSFISFSKLAAQAALLFGAALGTIGPILKALGGLIAGLVDAIKQLSGVFGLIPGLASQAGVALTTVIVGVKGLSSAWKAGEEDGAAFLEAIKDMPPALQALARGLKSVRDDFRQIKDVINSNMWEDLGSQFAALSSRWLPALKDGLGGVATSVNGVVKEFVKFLSLQSTMDDSKQIMADTATVIDNLKASVIPLSQAFTDLAAVGSKVFTELTAGAGAAAQKFADFIAEARRTGALEKWIAGGIQALRDLWNIIKNIYTGIAGFWEAVGGSKAKGALATVRDLTEQFTKFTNSISGQQKIAEFVEPLKKISGLYFGNLVDLFNGLRPALADLMPFITRLAESLSGTISAAIKLLTPLIRGLAKVLNFLGPVIAPVAAGIFTMGIAAKSLGIAAKMLSPFVSGMKAIGFTAAGLKSAPAAFRNLRNAAMGIGGATGPMSKFANKLSTLSTGVQLFGLKVKSGMVRAKNAIARGASGIAGAFGSMAGRARAGMSRVASAISSGASVAGSAASTLGGKVKRGLSTAVSAMGTAAASIGGKAKLIGAKMASGFATAGRAIGTFSATMARGAARAVAKMAIMVGSMIAGTATIVAGWISQAATAMASAISIAAAWVIAYWPILLVIALVAGAVALIIMYWDQIKAFLIATWKFIKQTAITVWNALKAFFIALWNTIKTIFITVWNAIKTALVTVWRIIKTVAMTVWNALKAFFVAFWTGIKTIFMTIWNAIKTFLLITWNRIKAVAMAIWNGLKAFFTALWNGIKAVTMAVWNGIKAFLSAAWNFIKSTAMAVWNGLKSLIMSVWNGIKSFITSAVNSIKNFIMTGFNAAKDLAVNAFNALKDGVTNTISTLMGIISGIPGKIMGFLGDLGSLLLDSGKALIQGFIDGIMSMIGAVGDAISSVASTVTDFMPWSPAKKGPLSGRGWVYFSGLTVGPAFAKGILKNAGAVKDAMGKFAAGVNTSIENNMPGYAEMRDHGQRMIDGLISGIRDRYGYLGDSFDKMVGQMQRAQNFSQAIGIAQNSTFAKQLSSEINRAFAGVEANGVLRYSGGRLQAQGQAKVPGTGTLIGSLTVETPQGADAQDVIDEAMFAVRRAGKGVYN